jgi:serine/tyrosine/threonine adenylyltransferase
MNDLPQAATDILDVADFLGDAVAGADFPQTILRFRNDRAAATIGLASLSDQDWIRTDCE